MSAEAFEVGLFIPDAQGEPMMIPRTWDSDTVLRAVPWMRLQNRGGRNVYIRPRGEQNLSLVDDLTADAVALMKSTLFSPALVVRTSPGLAGSASNGERTFPVREYITISTAPFERHRPIWWWARHS
jgi:hypothetical protein